MKFLPTHKIRYHWSTSHRFHRQVQLPLSQVGVAPRGCRVKRFSLLCLLWLQSDRRRAKSQVDYCEPVSVIAALSSTSMRAIKQKDIAHLNFDTPRRLALGGLKKKKKTLMVQKVTSPSFGWRQKWTDIAIGAHEMKEDWGCSGSGSIGGEAMGWFRSCTLVTCESKASMWVWACALPCSAPVLAGTEGRPGNCCWSGWRIHYDRRGNTRLWQTCSTPAGAELVAAHQ